MPWNVLILPLLAGYFYCTRCNKVKFKYRQADGNRLLLASALHGLVFLLLSTIAVFILGTLAPRDTQLEGMFRLWIIHNPYPHLGKSLLALAVSGVATLLVNFFWTEDREKYKVLEEENETFELLLKRSVDKTSPLLFSLSNQKVYVALALDRLRIDRKHISVLPLLSGYRNKETQEVVFTTDYSAVYDKLSDEGENLDKIFELLFPADMVVSATLFDRGVYEEHFARKEEAPAEPLPATPSERLADID